MNRHIFLILLLATPVTQASASDWNTHDAKSGFTGPDLARQQTLFSTRVTAASRQTLSYYGNDHKEVHDVFNRDHTYQGLHFTNTAAINNSKHLHFSTQTSSDEQHAGGVFSSDGWLFGMSAGRGQNFVKSAQLFTGIDPYFIHGGSTAKFSYFGTNAGYEFDGGKTLYFGSSTIESNRLYDRHAHYGGIITNNFSATLMNIKRDGKSFGKGIELAATMRKHQFGYRQISHSNGAHSKTFSLELPASLLMSGRLGFAVESINNPLDRRQDDLNFMLTLSGRWGSPSAGFNSAEQKQQEQSQTTGLNKMAVIGAGAVAAAIIVSSGSSKDDNARIGLSRQHDAARRILNEINPRSVSENREYGGVVYRNPNGSFSNTAPVKGDENSLLISLQTPRGTRATAFYHTHAAFDPRYDNENFSPTDINSANRANLDSYLGTPAGAFKFYDVSRDQISTLGTIAN